MNRQTSKKVNSKQKTIVVLALIVTLLLAVCVTFAWYTNRINVMNGKISLGKFDYEITLYDVDTANNTVDLLQTKAYDIEDSDKWSLSSQTVGVGSHTTKYQIVKVKNKAAFGIKAYEYLEYPSTVTPQQEALANYFYFRPFKLNISGDASASDIESFLSTYQYTQSNKYPSASDIASPSTGITFGTIKNNAVAFDTDAVEGNTCSYYLIGYCVDGLPDEMLTQSFDAVTVEVDPIVTIGQANGPIPQTTSTSQVVYADTWQELRTAIASANNGDTIFLTRNIESPAATNLSITKAINLNLNGYTLTVHGDLVFNYKTTDARKLTVPSSSKLYVDGNLYVECIGPFSLNSTGSSKNVFLGKLPASGEVTGGKFYVNSSLKVDDDTPADLDSVIVYEDSGFTLNNIQIQTMGSTGEYTAADMIINGSDTMVKVAAGAKLNSITETSGIGIRDIYIANYGIINSVSLESISYPSNANKCVAYIKNYNTVNTLALGNGAKGYNTSGSTGYNTRVINGDGSLTAFSGNYATNFRSQDIEPFNQSTESSYVVENDATSGTYTVYLKNVAANTGANYESISALFTHDGYQYTACKNLRVVTSNGITLKPAQFENIRDNFSVLEKIDLSSCAVANATIPANAMNATVTGAKTVNLKEVVLPVTSISIGENAFKGTAISEVTISSNVESIGAGAFSVGDETRTDDIALEVIWDRSDDVSITLLNGFNVNKTTIFMETSLAQRAMDATYTDAWKLNMYEFYDFKAENSTYYCKYSRDGSTTSGCEIVYYAGTIASKAGNDLVPAQLNDGSSNYTVVAVNRQAFRKAIINDAGATTAGVQVNLASCVSIGDRAFEATSATPLTIRPLSLGQVKNIGKYAFSYNTILVSEARPASFVGMVSLGSYAFQNATVVGGILDLHGPSEKYTPDDYALDGINFSGQYASNANTGNAVLDLRNVDTFSGTFANGATIYSDILLSGSGSIAGGAFSNAIYPNDNTAPTNIVDARNIGAIGKNAFYNIQCGTLYLGTHDSAVINDSAHPYVSIIGSTRGTNIKTLVLDGGFATASKPALAGATSDAGTVTIETLKIARTTDTQGNVVKTTIPAYAFATNRTVNENHNFTMNPNLTIGAVDTSEEVSGETVYASFDIGASAFRGTGFSDRENEYDFEGVVNIGERAFESSTIVSLNLGNSIESIAAENFIWYCDSISTLTIERSVPSSEIDPDSEEQQYFPEYMVTLGGVAAADEKISHTGEKLASFKIVVDTNLVTTYVNDTVWTGWKDYFEPLVYHVDRGNNRWYVTIIDPNKSDRGCHVIGWERVNKSLALDITLPATLPIPGKGSYKVTAFGTDEDMFKELTDDENVSTFYIDTFAFTNIKTLNAKAFQSPKLTYIQNPSGSIGNGAAIKWNYDVRTTAGSDRYILYKSV